MTNRAHIEQRVIQAAKNALEHQQYVSAIDVLLGMDLLQPAHLQNWRKGKVPFLEKVIQGNLNKISYAMKCFRKWAHQLKLKPSETAYMRWGKGPNKKLQFSKSGDPQIELAYRTHYISPVLTEKKQQKLKENIEQPPEPTVFIIVSDSQCSQCHKELQKGSFLFLDGDQPLCLRCAELSELAYLPRGNAKLTRRASQYSATTFVVLKFSRARKHYERQGILVQEEALQKAQREVHTDGVKTDSF